MTTPTTTPQASFGPTLAFADQTLTEVLNKHLAKRQTNPETWYALQLIAIRGPSVTRETLIRGLERSRNVKVDSIKQLLANLEAEGLVHGDEEIKMTEKGQVMHSELREYVAGPTAQLLGQFNADDIATTVRTLKAVTARASEKVVQN